MVLFFVKFIFFDNFVIQNILTNEKENKTHSVGW